ncbi:MAG TPA: GGDEF domain-containing protein [Blastocatellia bacterium]|nr:GGDEF domain-containing protein [Blastocatellia bacterium]
MNDGERTLRLDVKEVLGAGTKRPVIVILQGQSLGLALPLQRAQTLMGRGTTCDVVLSDEIASRQHAEIIRLDSEDGCAEYYLNDLGSTNGTFLNGSRVASQQLLQDGDKIKIGNHLMKFAMLDEFEAEFQDRLHQMTQRDELTGLKSRRSLFADIDRLVTQAARREDRTDITVLMMDLDFFKQVNDRRGHLIGSHTIREVGHLIRDSIGNADLAARYGGEEYLAYVLGPRERGMEVAENIRRAVEAHEFPASTSDLSETMRITISLGIASYPDDASTALDLIQKADHALYRAKLTGRNRTCVYDPESDKHESPRTAVDASAIMYGPADAQ